MSIQSVRKDVSRVPLWARIAGAAVALALVLVAFNATRENAVAATFSVDSTTDLPDANTGDSTCATVLATCTLRAAIQQANATGGAPHTVTLPAGTYELTIAGVDEDAAATGDLDITVGLTITGAGAGATIIDANGLDRAFHVHGPGVSVSFEGITVIHGRVATGGGGAILSSAASITVNASHFDDNQATSGVDGVGGAIFGASAVGTGSTVAVSRSTFTDNVAAFGGGGISTDGTVVPAVTGSTLTVTDSTFESNVGTLGGGGIYSNGPSTTIQRSTFIANESPGGVIDGRGGGVHSNSAAATIENSTFFQNTARTGGAVDNREGDMEISNSTLVGNVATITGHSLSQDPNFPPAASLTVRDSILSGAGTDNCQGAITDDGENITFPVGEDCNAAADVDPLLAPAPEDNGGPTLTLRPLAGSPAIDGAALCAATTDQRGGRRPINNSGSGIALCDVGSFELGLVVTNPGDANDGSPGDGLCDAGAGECSLRAAIQEANAGPGLDFITFDILAALVVTISPASALPTLTDPVFIDGASQPGSVCSADTFVGRNLLIEIDGGGLDGDGLTVGATADGSSIRGLSIGGFPDPNPLAPGIGLRVLADNVAVECNHLGVGADGSTATPNRAGLVVGSSVIGGTVRGNVLSGNSGTGMRVQFATNVNVTNNRIGMAADGDTPVPNGVFGLRVLASTNTVVGGSNGVTPGGACTGDCNLISGNDPADGVYIDSSSQGTVLRNNFIGTDVTGTQNRGNAADGITIESGAAAVIEQNLISGNGSDGIHFIVDPPEPGPGTSTVRGNRIGTNTTGTGAIGNVVHGIHITGGVGMTIGGPSAADRNVISGNGQAAINACGLDCFGEPVALALTVEGNYIGTNGTGDALLTNGSAVAALAFDDVAGAIVRGNVVASSAGFTGIWFQDSATPTVEENLVGLNAAGTGVLGVSGSGIFIDTTSNGLVTSNTVAGATGNAIELGDGAEGNTVLANSIGTDASQNVVLGNGGSGISVSLANNNIIQTNLIVGSGGDGIRIDGSDGNTLTGNAIGFIPGSSPQPAGNGNGIGLLNACDTTIGMAGAGEGNTIGFSTGWGVRIEGSTCAGLATNALIQNRIGTVLPLLADIGNGLGGVLVQDSTGVLVGFDGQPANVITNNGGPGVRVNGALSIAIIGPNSIYANDGFLGIDLVAGGDVNGDFRTPNDPTDNDSGPNSLQNTPVITNVTVGEGNLTIDGTLPGGSGVTTYHFFATDQFLPGAACSAANPASSVGQRFLGSAGSNGDTFSILLVAATLGANEYVTATATADLGAGTSEFSPCFVVGGEGGGAGLSASIFAGAASVPAGASAVPIIDIPLSALSTLPDAVQGVPISAIDIDSSPISAIPISAIPISAITVNGVPISAIPISAIPISAIPISAIPIDDWEDVIAGTALEGVPLQSITFQQVMDDTLAWSRIQNAPISAIELFSTSLRNVSITSVLLGATPISAIAGTNTWLCPTASSLCTNGETLMAAEIEGLPISAIPISAIPISAIPISAIELAGTPISAIAPNASPISAIDLNSIPISAIPISAIPISAIPISAIPISAIPISAIGVGGAPISAIPISAIGPNAIVTPTGQAFCDYAASLGEPCGSATTIGQFVGLHGVGSDTLASVPISAIPISAIAALTGFEDSLGWLIGFDTVGHLYDANGHLGTMTMGQLVVLILEAENYPWEELPLDKVDLQSVIGTGPALTYTVEHTLASGGLYAASVSVTLPRGFVYKKGSSAVDAVAAGDPVISGSVLNYTLPGLTAATSHELTFDAFSSLSTGSAFAIATVSAEGENVTTVSGTVVVTEAFEPENNDPFTAPEAGTDTLYLSHIGSVDDVDFFQVPDVAAGSRIAVYLSQLGVDMDLVMYTGNQLPINSTSLTAIAPQTLPVGDQGAGAVQEGQFLEPQTLQDIAIQSLPIKATSALRGTADETIEAIALRDDEGPYFVAVRSYNRAVTEAPYVLRVRVTAPPPVEVCPSPFLGGGSPTAALAGYIGADANTAIVVNTERLAQLHGQAEADALIAKLNEFATRTDVKGQFIDVSNVSYAAYDANPCDPEAANAVVSDISALTLGLMGSSDTFKHLVIVGGDDIIPMARIPDLTRISNERDYRLDLVDLKGGAFGAAASGHYLSDDVYGDFDPIPWLERFLYVPDVGIGRLVETPSEIQFALQAFINSGGALNPESALAPDGISPGPDSYAVTGYDFLADGAVAVDGLLGGQGWTTGSFFALINESWDRAQLLALLASGRSVHSINAHFDHFRLLPASQNAAGLSDDLVTTADVENMLQFEGKLIFSMGCHSGLNVSDLLAATGDARTQDWAQTFVSRGAVLIGNTGYGYGDTESVALSERLMALFAKRMDGSISAAQALTFAKQDYYATLGLYGVYDEKALMQTTYYGLPMYRIDEGVDIPTPAELPIAPAPDGGVPGTSSAQVTVSPGFVANTSDLGTFYSAGPGSTYLQGSTVTIDEVGTQVTHYQPIQPRLSFDVTDVNGLVAHGALITSLTTAGPPLNGPDQPINPVYARPIVDGSTEAEISSGDAVFPARLQAISSYNAPDGPRQNLVLVAGQFLPDGNPATDNGAQRLFTEIGAKVYYSASADFFAPDILRAEGIVNSDNVTFTVETQDRNAFGLPGGTVALVSVLYRDAACAIDCGDFAFQQVNLTPGPGGSWTATRPAGGAGKFEFLVQAVDVAGNVGVSTSKGVLFLTETLPPAAVILTGPSDPTTTTAASFSFGTVTPPLSPVSFECSLDNSVFAFCEDPAFYAGLGNGLHEFKVRAVNAAGAGPEAAFQWTVAATAPGVLIDPVAPLSVGTTAIINATANAQPTGAAINKVEYSVDGGLFQPGPTIVQGTSATFQISIPAPAGTGIMEVCIRATDVRGTVSEPACVLIAWIDVSAGFATGNLQFASAPGAYAADAGLAGPASINLNTKYKEGQSTPEGQADFSFPAAGLEFDSTSFEWLVISGNLVQLQAAGTINGSGSYQMLVSARDNGKSDTVRIKIWDASSGSLVYDNQPGAPNTAEPVVPVTAGNLFVHNK